MANKRTEAIARAQAKYDAEKTQRIYLKLNIRTDNDILEHLEGRNKQGYIKDLIRRDIADHSKK